MRGEFGYSVPSSSLEEKKKRRRKKKNGARIAERGTLGVVVDE